MMTFTPAATPLVSIGIPTFNRAEMLRECLASVLAQTYRNLEVIVSDNASSDHTPQVVDCFADRRIVYFRYEQSVFCVENFQNTLRLATGDFYKIQCDDDQMEPDCIAKAADVLQHNPSVALVLLGARYFGKSQELRPAAEGVPDGLLTGDAKLRALSCVKAVPLGSQLFRRAAGLRAGGYVINREVYSPDFDILLRLFDEGDVWVLNEPLIRERLHAGAGRCTSKEAYKGPGEWHASLERFLSVDPNSAARQQACDDSRQWCAKFVGRLLLENLRRSGPFQAWRLRQMLRQDGVPELWLQIFWDRPFSVAAAFTRWACFFGPYRFVFPYGRRQGIFGSKRFGPG